MALIALLATVSAGCLLVLAILPVENWEPRWAAWLLAASLGAGLGIAVNSCLLFLLLRAPGAARVVPYAVLLATAAACWLFRRRRSARGAVSVVPWPHRGSTFRWNWALGLAFAAGLLLVFGAILDSVEANPHGQWDAWSIWNLRAKFLAGPGETWRNAVSPLLTQTHSDYPLLQSAFIALLWKASGATTPFAPVATALVFFASTLGLLVSALALLRRLDEKRRPRIHGLHPGLLPGCRLALSRPQGRRLPVRVSPAGLAPGTAAHRVFQVDPGPRRRSPG
jgi:hypothetical protein